MKNIASAIIKVMESVKGMEKTSNVGSGKSAYQGTKDQDVKEVFNDALAKNGLCILPIGIEESTEVERWEEVDPWSKSTPKDMKQKQSVFTKVKTEYLLLHESGESIKLAGYGHGVDPQDKGAGKATTYALKNCLLYTFLTPVGKIDDTDETHSNEIKPPKADKAKPSSDELNNAIKNKVPLSELKEWFDINNQQATKYEKALLVNKIKEQKKLQPNNK